LKKEKCWWTWRNFCKDMEENSGHEIQLKKFPKNWKFWVDKIDILDERILNQNFSKFPDWISREEMSEIKFHFLNEFSLLWRRRSDDTVMGAWLCSEHEDHLASAIWPIQFWPIQFLSKPNWTKQAIHRNSAKESKDEECGIWSRTFNLWLQQAQTHPNTPKHTHYTINRVTWEESRDVTIDQSGRRTETKWKEVPGSRNSYEVESGRERGWTNGWSISD
jgi:hypothetical protein